MYRCTASWGQDVNYQLCKSYAMNICDGVCCKGVCKVLMGRMCQQLHWVKTSVSKMVLASGNQWTEMGGCYTGSELQRAGQWLSGKGI